MFCRPDSWSMMAFDSVVFGIVCRCAGVMVRQGGRLATRGIGDPTVCPWGASVTGGGGVGTDAGGWVAGAVAGVAGAVAGVAGTLAGTAAARAASEAAASAVV